MGFKMTSHKKEVLAMVERKAKAAMERCGAEMEKQAKQVVPVDTGHLRNSIAHDTETTRNTYRAVVGTNVEYAAEVELGTSKRKAKPYLKPAVTDHTDTLERIIKDELGN